MSAMSVKAFDGQQLDIDIQSTLWQTFHRQILPIKYAEELKLIITSLTFFLATKRSKTGTSTYGSRLTGCEYRTTKLPLYVATILGDYLAKQFSSSFSHQTNCFKVLKIIDKLSSLWEFSTFLQFVAGSQTYLSTWHKILSIQCQQTNFSEFYGGTVYASQDFSNKQLLWNAILEILNTESIGAILLTKLEKQNLLTNHSTSTKTCPNCNEYPINPTSISCCKSTYCYICFLRVLKSSQCKSCKSTTTLQGTLIYSLKTEESTLLENHQ
ncbi:LAMI_0F03048g1_1 [Lachancea mirantina]|uniref:LAMI_0F03048g1_1 n=1 Tax=Lachancea mirantina TaxID=1230905 RepID=A0A1G4JWX9_9SACH|nr:LAMI_0F03048g1_1 [Lachancea mirantina]